VDMFVEIYIFFSIVVVLSTLQMIFPFISQTGLQTCSDLVCDSVLNICKY